MAKDPLAAIDKNAAQVYRMVRRKRTHNFSMSVLGTRDLTARLNSGTRLSVEILHYALHFIRVECLSEPVPEFVLVDYLFGESFNRDTS